MNNPYQSPSSGYDVQDRADFELASRWQRLGGSFIDGIIGMVFAVPLMFYFGFFEYIKNGQEPPLQLNLIFAPIGFAFFLAVHGYLLSKSGQTVGKKIVGTRILSMDNNLLSLTSVVGKRYLPLMLVTQIPMLGQFIAFINYLFIFRTDKRCLHDLVAGTKVVRV